MASPPQALAELRSDPARFLRNYYLITVRAVGQSGPTDYHFGATGYVDLQGKRVYDRTRRPGNVLGDLHTHDSKNFKFSRNVNDLIGVTTPVLAWHIDVSRSAGIALNAIPSVRVGRTSGPDLMVTTLLNGCSFVCGPAADAVLMAHVQPTGGTSAAQLENSIMNTGALAGGSGASRVFGGSRCYTAATNDVTIVGVRRGTQWHVLAQIHPRNERSTQQVVEVFRG